ncbi:hypothetical protein E2C01_096867 [Portunus trituberculatus]|uniref:Uncharacterized protein n=1 Tax=Portunus trituberculatus TaxID=210409 RepID=A0A5B7K9L9_PORTR|nr:hypothetical protein [Portunus trituberculatus]
MCAYPDVPGVASALLTRSLGAAWRWQCVRRAGHGSEDCVCLEVLEAPVPAAAATFACRTAPPTTLS